MPPVDHAALIQHQSGADPFGDARFFDWCSDLLCVIAPEGRFVRLNLAWSDALGFTRAELMAETVFAFIHPDDHASTTAMAQAVMSGQALRNYENRYRCKHGGWKHLLWTANVLADGLVYGVARDITERRRMEDAQRAAAQKYRDLYQSLGDGLARLDGAGRFTDANAACAQMLGRTADELCGLPFATVVHERFRAHDRAFAAAARQGDDGEHELELLRADGSSFPVAVRRWTAGDTADPEALWTMLRDLGERRHDQAELARARADALAAARIKDEFLAAIGHELRTPLGGVVGLIELLSRETLNDLARVQLDNLRHASDHLTTVVDELLDRAQALPAVPTAADNTVEILRPNLAAFAPRRLAQELIELITPELRASHLALIHAQSDHLPACLMSDVNRLRQALLTLLGTAMRFAGASATDGMGRRGPDRDRAARYDDSAGTVTFALEWRPAAARAAPPPPHASGTVPAAQLRITIATCAADPSKAGLPPEVLAGLFAPSHGAALRPGAVALDVSRRWIEALGGTVTVDSDRSGSRFTVLLPCALAAVADPVSGSGATAPPQLRGRVLLVEDHAVNRRIAERMLSAMGLVVDLAVCGNSALTAEAQVRYDAIFLDCQLPGCDGYAVAARIRAREHERSDARVPIIAITAHTMPGDRARCLTAGMDQVLTKPLRADELYASARRWLPPATAAAGQPDAGLGTERLAELLAAVGPEVVAQAMAEFFSTVGAEIEALATTPSGGAADNSGGAAETFITSPSSNPLTLLARRLHRIKGASANLGFARLAQMTGDLDRAVAGGADVTAVAERIAALRQEFARLPAAAAAALSPLRGG